MTNRHVESFELLKQEVKGSFLLQVLVVPPFNQDNLRHHQLEENIQEDPGRKRSFTIATCLKSTRHNFQSLHLMRSVSGDFQRSADCGGMRGRIGAGETGPSPGGWINWSVINNMERLVDHRLNQHHQGPGYRYAYFL